VKNKTKIENLEKDQLIEELKNTLKDQQEFIMRAMHCLQYFEEQYGNAKVRFWANQCVEDLKRRLVEVSK
jgi:hypothetical protein